MSIRALASVGALALFLALLPRAGFAEVSFRGGWEQGVLTGPGNWAEEQEVAADRMQIVTDIVRNGGKAMRVEVRPGDNPLDCCSSTERAELTIMTNPDNTPLLEGVDSGTQYLAFSVRLDPDFQFPLWSILLQLHGPDDLDAYPLIAIGVDANGYNLEHFGGDVAVAPRIRRALGPATLGQWTDFILEVTFAKGPTGDITVWRRNEGQDKFYRVTRITGIPTLQYRGSDPVGGHYWKAGLYRSKEDFANTLWNDGVTRASTYEEALASFDVVAPVAPTGP
jgi:hypothetical protein